MNVQDNQATEYTPPTPTDDVSYQPAVSIYSGDVEDSLLAHRPCPDMEGMANYDPKNAVLGQTHIDSLRARFGLKAQTQKKQGNPLSYRCTEKECIGPLIGTPSQEPKEVLDARWRMRLKNKGNGLPMRRIVRKEDNETA